MLDPQKSVMAIWPAPMVYGGPTEVQLGLGRIVALHRRSCTSYQIR